MKKRDIISVLVILLLEIWVTNLLMKNILVNVNRPIQKTDTITYVDTIPYYKPVPKDSIVVKYHIVKLPLQAKDSVAGKADSVDVVLPITQQIYKDSAYQAWISGYHTQLDSIHIYSKNTTITKTQTITTTKYKAKRWGVGIQVGGGYNFNQISPYIGFGIQYNILNW